jgi:hypothetical protein
VALGRTDVLEERIDSIIGVTRIDELGTMFAVTSNIPDDDILHSNLHENLKSYI